MSRLAIATCFVGVILSATTVIGAEYPTKSIRLIVPAGLGSATDRYARLIAQSLSETLHQPVVAKFQSQRRNP